MSASNNEQNRPTGCPAEWLANAVETRRRLEADNSNRDPEYRLPGDILDGGELQFKLTIQMSRLATEMYGYREMYAAALATGTNMNGFEPVRETALALLDELEADGQEGD